MLGQRQSDVAGERDPLLGLRRPSDLESVAASGAQHRHDAGSSRKLAESGIDPHWDGQWRKNLVLLLGVFLVNSDSAILLAFSRTIGSDFGQMSSANWIVNSCTIGLILAQPLYGKLSDIYGRKPLLLIAYVFCCVGGLLGGIGFSFWGLLLGRFFAGIGNAGIAVLVSTLIVDLVPIREVAVWRSYVYSVNQIGRAIGPPLGGLIAEQANWRWSLLYSVPLNVLGFIFVWRHMSFPSPLHSAEPHGSQGLIHDSWRSKFGRIDVLGSVSLGLTNLSLLLFLDQLQRNPDAIWSTMHSALAVVPLSTWLVFLAVFVAAEAFWAREPILPLRLLAKRNVFSSYSIQFLQTAAQTALFTSVPLYFKVTMGDSSTTVAARLSIMTMGTVVGGLISGFVIKRTGQYRIVTIVSIFVSNASFLAVFLRWRGAAGWLETLYGFPIGMGFGVSLSAAFIGLTSGVEPSKVAVSTSGFYMSLNLGSLIGVSSASLLISSFVERTLRHRLHGIPDAGSIIHDVTSNFDTIEHLPGRIREIVLDTYTQSFANVWLYCFTCGCLALLASLLLHQGQLDKKLHVDNKP